MAVSPTHAPTPSGETQPLDAPATAHHSGFRPDIDGLRAVAIVLVVAFHAKVAGFSSGFIGVDMFFVISGYLIMSQLEREFGTTGSIGLLSFWARRARRLIPAAAVVILAVLAASFLVYSALQWQTIAAQALAATFYVSNEAFRNAPTGYFAPAIELSPLLNTWSLAVEEQFYLFWPSLLVLVTRSTARRSQARRNRVITVCVVVVCSFAFSQIAIDGGQSNVAYFSSISRAWEFGVGALLALFAARCATLSPAHTRSLLVLGLALLAWAMLAIDGHTPFPGRAALLPVLATASLLVAGAGRDQLTARTFGCAPMQAVGRLSYSWYLWHWPVMVIGLSLLDDDTTQIRVVLVLLSLAPSLLTYRYLERTLRRQPRLVGSNRRTFAVMLGFMGVATVGSLTLWIAGAVTTSDPYVQRLAEARADVDELQGECATNDLPQLLAHCVWGDPQGGRTVLVVGDSHAAHWLPSLHEIGRQHGLRIVASIQGSCPSIGDGFATQLPSCETKLAGTEDLIAQVDPDLAVFANSVGYLGSLVDRERRVVPVDQRTAVWQRGVEARADQLERRSIPMLIILDTTRHREDPIDCLVKTREVSRCRTTATDQEAVLGGMHAAERAGLADAGWGSVFDAMPYLCPNDVCDLEQDGHYVYADEHHLTRTESRALAEPLAERVLDALAGSPQSS